jgi:hypothetical protein
MRIRSIAVVAAGVAFAGLANACGASSSRDAGVQPVRPDGPVPAADRSSLRGRVAYSLRSGIWVMNADGSHRVRLTSPGAGVDFSPSLSPDGRRVVFRTSRGNYLPDRRGIGLEGIFVVDVRTRRERPIHPPRGALFPEWSPDGTGIAFSTLRHGGNIETIHVVTPAGKQLRELGGPSFHGAAMNPCPSGTWSSRTAPACERCRGSRPATRSTGCSHDERTSNDLRSAGH